MNLGDLQERLSERLDDESAVYYLSSHTIHALNVAQRLFALLTLCVERTANFSLSTSTYFNLLSASISDLIVPLRITLANGARLVPTRIHDLDGLSDAWRAATGTPTHYVQEGHDALIVTPRPTGASLARITYAAVPAALALSGDVPEIPEEHHPCLIDFAIWYLRLKEGGQEHAKTVDYLNRFLDDAEGFGDYVRARAKAQGYNRQPPDISLFDRSRLTVKLKQIAMSQPQNRKAA